MPHFFSPGNAGSGGGGISSWSTSTVYAVNQMVYNSQAIFVCKVAHTSGTFVTDVAAGKWAFVDVVSSQSPNLMMAGNNFEDNTVGGWTGTGCATITNGLPVTVGSGGNPFSSSNGGRALGANTTAPAVTSSSPINELYSLNLATSGAGTIGDGYISSAIPISSANQAKVLALKIKYKVASGTPVMAGTSANTYAAAVYDVTNNAWLGLAGAFDFVQSSGVGEFNGTFQTASTTAAIQIFVYSPVAPTGASSLLLDDFFVGRQSVAYGSPVTDWQAFTPTGSWSSNTTYTGYWRRVGDSMEIEYRADTSGAPTSANLTFNLPSGYSIDKTKLLDATHGFNTIGTGLASDSGTNYKLFATTYDGIIYAAYQSNASGVYSTVTQAAPFTFGAGDFATITVKVPITGWSSSVVMSSDASTRIVAAIISGDPASATSGNPIIVPTVGYDSHGAYNASTGRYTCPVPGIYKMYGALQSASSATTLSIYKNALSSQLCGNLDSNGEATFAGSVLCVAGDIIDIRPGGTVDATSMSLNIELLSGPAQIAASESVNARYYASSTSVPSVTITKVVWTTKDFDSHNAMSSGTFTCPSAGKYQVNSAVSLTVGTSLDGGQTIYIYKNAAAVSQFEFAPAGSLTRLSVQISDCISCVAGDTIDIRVRPNGTSPSITSSNTYNYISIARVGN